ncbi:MAG TPA: hypothetical protein P5317_07755 [Myxococcota bacterium]|nr:hypothetical protein [Myxococcota bacterium]HRV17889.1 hypothetical protein [Myxococcota bacterium]
MKNSVRVPALVRNEWFGQIKRIVAERYGLDEGRLSCASSNKPSNVFGISGVYGQQLPESLTGEEVLKILAELTGDNIEKLTSAPASEAAAGHGAGGDHVDAFYLSPRDYFSMPRRG